MTKKIQNCFFSNLQTDFINIPKTCAIVLLNRQAFQPSIMLLEQSKGILKIPEIGGTFSYCMDVSVYWQEWRRKSSQTHNIFILLFLSEFYYLVSVESLLSSLRASGKYPSFNDAELNPGNAFRLVFCRILGWQIARHWANLFQQKKSSFDKLCGNARSSRGKDQNKSNARV